LNLTLSERYQLLVTEIRRLNFFGGWALSSMVIRDEDTELGYTREWLSTCICIDKLSSDVCKSIHEENTFFRLSCLAEHFYINSRKRFHCDLVKHSELSKLLIVVNLQLSWMEWFEHLDIFPVSNFNHKVLLVETFWKLNGGQLACCWFINLNEWFNIGELRNLVCNEWWSWEKNLVIYWVIFYCNSFNIVWLNRNKTCFFINLAFMNNRQSCLGSLLGPSKLLICHLLVLVCINNVRCNSWSISLRVSYQSSLTFCFLNCRIDFIKLFKQSLE